MKITISGVPGSGKSSVAKALAEKLNLKHYSAGDIRRELAAEKGMSILEYNRWDEVKHEGDRAADELIKNKGEKEENIVVDGRIPFHFIPDSVKVFLKVEPLVGAERVISLKRNAEKYSDLKEAMKKLEEREESDAKRFKELYQIPDYRDEKNFDLVLDTTKTKAEEIVEKIIRFIR